MADVDLCDWHKIKAQKWAHYVKNYQDASSTTKKKKLDKKFLIAIAIIIILAVALALQFHSLDAKDTPGIVWDQNAVVGGLEQRSEEEIQAELNQQVEAGMIRISMNTEPTFASGTTPGNLMIVNDATNNYPQVVYLVRQDTGEEIYRSGAIAVGSKVETAALDVALPAGRYPCVAYFNNVDPETGDYLGTAGAEITVVVEH